jgi:hypothetical protein
MLCICALNCWKLGTHFCNNRLFLSKSIFPFTSNYHFFVSVNRVICFGFVRVALSFRRKLYFVGCCIFFVFVVAFFCNIMLLWWFFFSKWGRPQPLCCFDDAHYMPEKRKTIRALALSASGPMLAFPVLGLCTHSNLSKQFDGYH